MPLKFVQSLIEFMQTIQKLNEDNEADENKQKLKSIVNDLYECSISTHLNLKQAYQRNQTDLLDENTDSITNVSEFNFTSNSSSCQSSIKIPVQINDKSSNDTWGNAFLVIENESVCIESASSNVLLNLSSVVDVKCSNNCK